jgi:hypothetical protein
VRNVKLLGWNWLGDGVFAGRRAVVEDSFIKANDDSIKAYMSHSMFRRCTVWQLDNGTDSTILTHYAHTLYSHTMLTHYTHTLCAHTMRTHYAHTHILTHILTLYAHTLYSHTRVPDDAIVEHMDK